MRRGGACEPPSSHCPSQIITLQFGDQRTTRSPSGPHSAVSLGPPLKALAETFNTCLFTPERDPVWAGWRWRNGYFYSASLLEPVGIQGEWRGRDSFALRSLHPARTRILCVAQMACCPVRGLVKRGAFQSPVFMLHDRPSVTRVTQSTSESLQK